ncbi:uncharacterized protein [Asterias amurensis]|uniref:uncharacterized protein n=1 Tax=Asterias amurensis TaxID=7602 RepID=UPI003AB29D84
MNDIGINKFLGPLGLLQYAEIFQIKGYDVESDFCSLNTGDLDAMNITHAGHRETILQAATNYQPSEEFEVFQWLRDNGIDHYFGNFIRSNYTTLRQVSIMELTSEVLHELEVLLPGHRKRLKNALPKLRKRRRIEELEAEVPVAIGYWGKPSALEGAKYDFLCIQATLKSNKPDSLSFVEEFMVDSGSDVVTARQEILDQLDLELIGTIQSRGVHTTVEKQLYKAILRIGKQEAEIEVMPEPYESIGNRVMRHFRHVIDSTVHYWLQGNRLELGGSSGQVSLVGSVSGEHTSHSTPETLESGESKDGSTPEEKQEAKGSDPGTRDVEEEEDSSASSEEKSP